MKQKIKDLFRKAYNKLFRKKTRETIWGRKFDETSTVVSQSGFLQPDGTTSRTDLS